MKEERERDGDGERRLRVSDPTKRARETVYQLLNPILAHNL